MGFATPPFGISTMTVGGNDPIIYKEPEPCRWHHGRRMSVGPTGRKKRFMVIADVCYACGYIMQTYGKLSWQQQDWVRRSNARINVRPV
jgi:hypothetical protein